MRAAWRLAALALDDPVDGHLRHPPPGRELAAGDRDEARSSSRTARPCGRCRPTSSGRRSRSAAARPRTRPVMCSRPSEVVEVLVDRVRAGTRCRRRRAARGRARPRSRCRSSRSACARATAARRCCGLRRPGTIAPTLIGRSRWARVMCVPRLGRMRGTSSSSCSSSGRIWSAHTPVALITFVARISNSPPRDHVGAAHADGAALVGRQLLDAAAVRADRAEPLGLAEDRQDEPRVVGLAVVEEVRRRRLARRRAPATARAPRRPR